MTGTGWSHTAAEEAAGTAVRRSVTQYMAVLNRF